MDLPNERSSHSEPTPRGGGVAIVLTFYIGLLFLLFTDRIEKNLFFALLPGTIIAFVGFIDDIRNLNMWIRLIIQILSSIIALIFLGGMHPLLGSNIVWLWSVIAVIGMVWFINLFNFLDGSDGYASMEAMSISLAIWFFTRTDILLLVAFSVGGFLIWNWPKAKIFLGDSGSTALGFIIIVLGLYFHNTGSINLFFLIFLSGLFWFDATITLFRRIIHKAKPYTPHKNHMYQRAVQGGFSHLQILVFGLCINILLFAICLLIRNDYFSVFQGFILEIMILSSVMAYVDHIFPHKSG